MAASSTPSSSTSTSQEYTVRIPKDKLKSFSMMKFGSSSDLDFAKLGTTSVSIARENNFKEFKTANDIDLMPKFGAGSEFGREQKEEARRKKYGRMTRTYNPDAQPWTMKIGSDKKAKRYKGVREGTITENTSYYIFTQCADGAFEAYPVEEWYNFTPVIKYKFLNSDEAEEHFSRRDKTLNYFNIMVKKRMKKDDGTEEPEEDKSGPRNKKKSKSEFMLTDKDDDWRNMSEDEDGDDEEENGEQENGENMKGKDKKGKKKKAPIKKHKNAKINSDDEAVEESDEGDYDDKEVDYMSDSSSDLSEKEEEDKEKDAKDEEKGVAEEDGLRILIDSEAEDDEENEEKEETLDDIDKDQKNKKEDESESSSSSSASDSDIEKDESISSALFMAKGSGKKKSDSRPASPNIEDRGIKRKMELDDTSGKKARTNSPVPATSSSVTSSSSNSGSSSEGITEEAIRRYLMRKPMTTKDLLTKFRSKKLNMTSEQMTHIVAQLLKKINPDKKFINKVLYLSLKKTD